MTGTRAFRLTVRWVAAAGAFLRGVENVAV